MAINDPSRPIDDQAPAELDNKAEEMSLDEAEKTSGGGNYGNTNSGV